MLYLLLLPLLASYASAQVCECALFIEGYEDHQIPVEYLPDGNYDSDICNDTTTCEEFCNAEYTNTLETRSMCFNNPSFAKRCAGSLYCEILHNQNATGDVDAPGILFFRILACENNTEWQEVMDARPTNENLCCEAGLFCGDCNNPANKPCYDEDLCEGGVFATAQFDDGFLEETNPLPLQYMGESLKADFECPYIPGANPNSRCDRKIEQEVDLFFGSLDLNEDRPVGGVTWGQSYCGALYQRWGLEWPMEGANTTLEVRSRMIECDLFWGDYIYAYHNQDLCCDGEGNYYEC